MIQIERFYLREERDFYAFTGMGWGRNVNLTSKYYPLYINA